MADGNLVIAIFEDEAAADNAAAAVKRSGVDATDAIGVLVLDGEGRIKTHKVGSRDTVKGAGIGALLGLLGPIGLGVGLVGGTAAGGLLGRLHHKGLGLDESDRDRISAELAGGKAAVGVLTNAVEGPALAAKLQDMGGVPEVHEVSDEALEAVADAAAGSNA
jgi:hypothetical protein